jgi:hypothetical protein
VLWLEGIRGLRTCLRSIPFRSDVAWEGIGSGAQREMVGWRIRDDSVLCSGKGRSPASAELILGCCVYK